MFKKALTEKLLQEFDRKISIRVLNIGPYEWPKKPTKTLRIEIKINPPASMIIRAGNSKKSQLSGDFITSKISLPSALVEASKRAIN